MGAFGTTHRRAFLAAGWVRGFECDVLDLSTYSRLLMHGCTRSQARTTTSRHSAASSACRSPAATSASRPATTADPPSMASDATRSAWRAMRRPRPAMCFCRMRRVAVCRARSFFFPSRVLRWLAVTTNVRPRIVSCFLQPTSFTSFTTRANPISPRRRSP